MTCSCCGQDKATTALLSRDDVELCRDCVEWLVGQLGMTSTPTLPVVNMAKAVVFYERAGFGVRTYIDDNGEPGEGFAFVDFDGQSVFDLDAAPELDRTRTGASCYLISPTTPTYGTPA